MSSLRVSGICSIVGYRLRFHVSFLESVANNPPFSSPFVGNPAVVAQGMVYLGVPPTLPHVPPHVTTGYGRNSLNLDGDEAPPDVLVPYHPKTCRIAFLLLFIF